MFSYIVLVLANVISQEKEISAKVTNKSSAKQLDKKN